MREAKRAGWRFDSMDDFDPANVVKQVEPLRKLLETRDKLRDMLTKVDRSEDLEGLLERVLQNSEELKKLQAEIGAKGAAGAGLVGTAGICGVGKRDT